MSELPSTPDPAPGPRARTSRGGHRHVPPPAGLPVPEVLAERLQDSAPTPLVSVADVLVASGLSSVPDVVSAAVGAQLAALEASLEAVLHRPLQPTSFTETILVGPEGRLSLAGSPLISVESLAVDSGYAPALPSGDPGLVANPSLLLRRPWAPGSVVSITYTAGLDPARYGPLIKAALVAKASQFLSVVLARAQVAGLTPTPGAGTPIPGPTPGVKSFSVEGLSVTYLSTDEAVTNAARAAAATAALTQWSPADLAGLGLGVARRPLAV